MRIASLKCFGQAGAGRRSDRAAVTKADGIYSIRGNGECRGLARRKGRTYGSRNAKRIRTGVIIENRLFYAKVYIPAICSNLDRRRGGRAVSGITYLGGTSVGIR